MKKILFILVLSISSTAFARFPTCFEVIPVFHQIKNYHLKDYSLDEEFLKKTIETYVKMKDPSNSLFYGEERSKIIKKFQGKTKKILNDLSLGSCEVYKEIDTVLEKKRDEWKKEVKRQLGAKKFPLKNVKEYKRNFTEPENLKDKKDYQNYITYFLNEFYKAYEKLDEKEKTFKEFVEKDIQKKKKLYSMDQMRSVYVLKSLVSTMDPHSNYFTTDEYSSFAVGVTGNQVGLGVHLMEDDLGAKIKKVLKNSAAMKAGIKEGDIITTANDKILKDYNINDIISIITGPEGTKVNLTIKREDEIIKKTVVRAAFEVEGVRLSSEVKEHNGKKILYLDLPSFYFDDRRGMGSSDDILVELEKNKKVDAIVLDLRDNGGGLLDEAIKVVSLFKKDPVAVMSKDKYGRIYKFKNPSKVVSKKPMVVLINRVSASASEIVAGALKDYHRALIVGDDHTYGKGTVQTITNVSGLAPMSSLGQAKVTNSMFFLPGGNSTQYKGVESDIVIAKEDKMVEFGERYFKNSIPYEKVDPAIIVENSVMDQIVDQVKKIRKDVTIKKHDKEKEDLVLNETLNITDLYLTVLNKKVD